MKSPKRLMALALAATLMCLPGASLAEDAAATDAPAAIEETTTTVAEDPNEVLATVNGVEITRARFNTFYQSMLSYYGSITTRRTKVCRRPSARARWKWRCSMS